MKKCIYSTVLVMVALFAGMAMLPHEALADKTSTQLVCYIAEGFIDVLKLNIKFHSDLSTRKEEQKFGHPEQDAFSVHGKDVDACGFDTLANLEGTVVVATEPDVGSHLGLHIKLVRPDVCKPVTLDCTSPESSSAPPSWECFFRNEFGVQGSVTLLRVVEEETPECSKFQDGRSGRALSQEKSLGMKLE
jgi:hypothetical protein